MTAGNESEAAAAAGAWRRLERKLLSEQGVFAHPLKLRAIRVIARALELRVEGRPPFASAPIRWPTDCRWTGERR